MVKLFLAEDEIAMREGIRRNIHWEEEGIEFCGEAGDGELAWPLIREKRPDIVITDIKMPFMDGLQLTALIKKELPDTRVIILSGYGEFEYAQEAVRLGVTEYLLKPITPRQLREVIRRLAEEVESEKRNREERFDWLKEEAREKEDHEKRRFYKKLVSGGLRSHEILEQADEIGLKLSAPYYRLALIYAFGEESAKSGAKPPADPEADPDRVDKMLRAISGSEEGCVAFEHSVDSLACLMTGKTAEETLERAKAIQDRAINYTQKNEGLHYFMSTGRAVTHLSEIHRVYREAYRAASYRFFLPPDQMVMADVSFRKLLLQDNPNPIDTDRALQNGNLRNIWENFMRTGTLQEAEDFVEDAFSSVGDDNSASILFLSYLTMDCYFSMVRFLKELGKDPKEVNERVGDINTVMGALHSSEDSRRYLTEYLREVIRQRDSSVSGRNDQLLRTALAYIDEHFADSSMSLQAAAFAAGLSPNRFSSLFSHEMGMTFIDYVIGKRMEKACELLMTTDMKSFEVAYSSGYNDPHYFSATFKKLKGMSPMEYRKRGQEEGRE